MLVAEHLASHHDVTVLTTCARDYVTWRNEYPRGATEVNGVDVIRFPVRRRRDPARFGRLQQRVFHRVHEEHDARRWLDAQGPYTPAMMRWLRRNLDTFDYVVCFSYRYWTTYNAMQIAEGKAILVPTAEPDPAIEMPLYHPLFRSARAIVYNSHEERAMIVRESGNDIVLGDIVGVGIVEPPPADPGRFRSLYGIDGPFVLYIGRVDRNKGCEQLFDYYTTAHRAMARDGVRVPKLLLAGSAILDIPDHPGIRYLGRVSDDDKYDALGASIALVMPSFFESLSMVLLEAWALERPVFVNAHCGVLEGQTVRAGGGLHYRDVGEFEHGLRLLTDDERLRDAMGANGRGYYLENYRWPVIEEKYERILQQLAREDA